MPTNTEHEHADTSILWVLLPGILLSITALGAVRPAYLYDTRYDENLGMFYVGLLSCLGAAVTLFALWCVAHRASANLKGVGVVTGLFSAGVPLFVLWVAEHDGGCVAGCGPF